MSKSNKDDRGKKNNYTQQILYDHLNLAERTGLAANLFHSGATQFGSFDARHLRRLPYTFATRRILSDINSPHTRLIPGMVNPARQFDSNTHSLLYAPEQPDHCRRGMGGEGREGVVGRAGSQRSVLEIETIIIYALFICSCLCHYTRVKRAEIGSHESLILIELMDNPSQYLSSSCSRLTTVCLPWSI